MFGTKLAEAPSMLPYNAADDLLLTLDGPYKLHPALQKLWEENKGRAPFGNHITNGRKVTHAGPKPYVGMLAAPVEGRGRSLRVSSCFCIEFCYKLIAKQSLLELIIR